MKKPFLFLSLIAALAGNSFAQLNIQGGPADDLLDAPGIDIVADNIVDHTGRERIVPEKAAAVEASVIVSTLSLEQTAFDLLNQKRVESGLKPLAWNEKLASVARVHSTNMAELNFFSHRGLDNKMVSDRADDNGLGRWRSIGENIAFNRGYQDPVAKAVQLWLDSPAHRRNLLDSNWKETAIGVAIAADGSYYLTQVFLKK